MTEILFARKTDLDTTTASLQTVINNVAAAQVVLATPATGFGAGRVGTNTATIAWDFGTPGQAKLNLISGGGAGVLGPAASTDNAVAVWNGTSGGLLKDSVLITTPAGDLTVPRGLRVGFTGTPPDDTVEVGDANFNLNFNTGTVPLLRFDAGDFFGYNRSSNAHTWQIGGADIAYLLSGVFRPATNDGIALGTAAESFADLFLASGAVVGFANGDVTITHSANNLAFAGAATAYTFDSTVVVGHTASITTIGIAPRFQVHGLDAAQAAISTTRWSADAFAGRVILGKSRGASVGTFTVVQSGDLLGQIVYVGADGTNLVEAAAIRAFVDATPGANDMPARLVFATTPDGASATADRLVIDSNKNVDLLYNNADANSGPDLRLVRDSASPAVNDILGIIRFFGKDSAANSEEYATIHTLILDPVSTSEDAAVVIQVKGAGAFQEVVRFSSLGSQSATISAPGFLNIEARADLGAPGSGPDIEIRAGDDIILSPGDGINAAGGSLKMGTTATEIMLRASNGMSVSNSPTTADVVPSHVLELKFLDASTNTVIPVLHINRQTTGTPALGIGASIEYSIQTAAATNKIGVTLDAITTDLTSTSEDFDFLIKLMVNGAAAAERYRFSTGALLPGSDGTIDLGSASKRFLRVNAVDFRASFGSFGFNTGVGGTVTQLTSKSTGVTINKPTGQITMNAAALAGDTTVSFVMTNNAIEANDIIQFNHISGGTPGSYTINGRSAAGSATIDVRNITTGSLSEAIVIAFWTAKGVLT